MIMHVIGRGADFPAQSQIHRQSIRYTPGVLQKWRELPEAHTERAVENVTAGGIHRTQGEIRQSGLRAGGSNLPRELSVEIECATRGEGREAVEAVPQEQQAKLECVRPPHFG